MASVTPQVEPAEPPPPPKEPGAVRSGVLVFAATVVSVAATYLFYLISGRVLGPHDYGELAAILALVTLVSLPFNAIQMALAREVSGFAARGETGQAEALARSLLRTGGLATVGLLALFGALMVPLADLLKLDSVGPLVFVAVALVPVLVFPVLLGDIQGRQEFRRLSVATAFPLVLRLVLFGVLLATSWELYAALAAIALSTVLELVLPAWWRRELIAPRISLPRLPVRPFLIGLGPVLIAILGVTALTNVDVLIVKARLASTDAGIYGAASAFAKVAFFLPTAIVAVVFPRVAARRARGLETGDILGRAIIATVAFCALIFTLYGLVGGPLVELTYGPKFAEAASLLGLFGIGMTFFSLANVLVSYHLSRHEPRFAWFVAAAAVCQAVALAVVPADLRTFLWVNAGVGIALIAAHELLMGSSVSALRAGAAHAWAEIVPKLRLRERFAEARRPLLEATCALAAYTGLAVLVTWPLATHIGSQMLGGGGDVVGTVSDFWRQAEFTGYHVTGASHVWMTGAPYGWEQGNGVNIQSSLVYYPAYLLTTIAGPVAAYNAAAFAGLVLSAAAMYWLVRRLTGSVLVAGWAGLVFMVFPWHMAKAEAHASLAHLEGFPLLALALLAWYRRPDWTRSGLIALTLVILWTTSGYYGLVGLVAMLFLLPVTAWFQRRRLGSRRAIERLVLGASGALLASAVIFGIASLGKARGEIAPERAVDDLAWYGARIWEFFVPAWENLLTGDATYSFLATRLHRSNFAETTLYVGWVTLLLALGYVVYVLLRRKLIGAERRYQCAAFSAMVVVAVIFMPPHPISLGSVNIPTPTWLVWKLVPQFRVPTRWMPLLMVGLICLAALALVLLRDRIASRAGKPAATRALAASFVAGVAVLSFFELSISPPARMTKTAATPEYVILEQAPPGRLVEYPLGGAGEEQTSDYLFEQRIHGRPLLNGGPAGSFPDIVRQVLIDPKAPGVAGALATLGVSAVITRDIEHPFEAGPFETPNDLDEGYRPVGAAYGGGTKVWAVTADPAPFAVFPYGFWFSERYGSRIPFQWMSSFDGRIEVIAPTAGRYLAHFQAQSFRQPRRLIIHGVGSSWSFDVDPYYRNYFMPVDLPRGRSVFTVNAEPEAELAPPPDGRMLSVYVSNWLFEPLPESLADTVRAVRPRLITPNPVPPQAPP